MNSAESPLNGRVAIVTGSSRGIGRELVLRLAGEGARVVVSGKSENAQEALPGTIHSVAEEVEALGGQALAVRCDVREESQVANVVEATVQHFGRLDIVINNAGALWWEPVLQTPVKRYDLMWQINVRAAFLTSYYALPHLVRNGWGHIIMNSPALSTTGHPGKAAYMTTKHGMTAVALGVAAEHMDDNVAANAIWPATPIDSAATRNWGSDKMGTPEQWRTPEIYVDAVMQVLTSEPRTFTGRAVTDEQVLRERGWSAERLDSYWVGGQAPADPIWIDDRLADGNGLPTRTMG